MTAATVLRLDPKTETASTPFDPERFTEFDVPSEEALAKAWGCSTRTVQRMALPFVWVGRNRFYPWARVVEELRRRAK